MRKAWLWCNHKETPWPSHWKVRKERREGNTGTESRAGRPGLSTMSAVVAGCCSVVRRRVVAGQQQHPRNTPWGLAAPWMSHWEWWGRGKREEGPLLSLPSSLLPSALSLSFKNIPKCLFWQKVLVVAELTLQSTQGSTKQLVSNRTHFESALWEIFKLF